VIDLSKVAERCALWNKTLPNIIPYYCVKCFPNPQVVKEIAKFGANFGFDCCSGAEIELVLSCGVSPDRIIFAHPYKLISALKLAREKNVNLLTFDNEEELKKIKQHHPKADIILRIDVQDADSAFPLQNKFGARGNDSIEYLICKTKELELNLVGVSFHVGTDITKPEAYKFAMENSLSVFDKAKSILGKDLRILDIGGGYPGVNSEIFQQIINSISSVKIPEHVQLIAEPGRFFVASCMSIYTTIFGKRKVGDVFHYHINDGYFGNLGIDAVRRIKPIPIPKNQYEDSELQPCKIWGPTCTAMDVVVSDGRLPELNIGDHICFQNVGAYTASLQTGYCSFKNDTDIYTDTEIHVD